MNVRAPCVIIQLSQKPISLFLFLFFFDSVSSITVTSPFIEPPRNARSIQYLATPDPHDHIYIPSLLPRRMKSKDTVNPSD